MKTLPPLILLAMVLLASCTLSSEKVWLEASRLEKSIPRTKFKDATYNILNFGAVPDDPEKLNHIGIVRAISECSAAGGGTVVVPAGTFHTGPIMLKSNVNLHLEEGAVLKFSPSYELYTPVVFTRWEGVGCYNTHPFIYANGETNIAITGTGVIDGNASLENWWYMSNQPGFAATPGQITDAEGRRKLFEHEKKQTMFEDRIMSKEDGLRPQLINLMGCSNVLIESVSIRNSPFWVLHAVLSSNIICDDLKISSKGPNSDGCVFESCKNVWVNNCYFDIKKDCIALKSGRNQDGRKWNVPSENILISKCLMYSGESGVAIGSEVSGGCSNVYIDECEMSSPKLKRFLYIKTNDCRGGAIEGVFARQVKTGESERAVVEINLAHEDEVNCDATFPVSVENIMLDHITSTRSQYAIHISGNETASKLSGITVTNSSFAGVSEGGCITGKASNLSVENVTINNAIQ